MANNLSNQKGTKELTFVKKDDISLSFDEILKKSLLSKLSSRNIVSTFDPSQVTECPTRLVYRARGTNITHNNDSAEYLLNNENTLKKWINFFDRAKDIKIISKEMVVADCNYNIAGKIDAIMNINGNIIAVKIYPVSNKNFENIMKEGAIKKNVIETMIYIWLAEIKDGIMLYDNKDTHEWTTFHVTPYNSILKSVMKKCIDLSDHMSRGTIPEKPYDSKTSKECTVCEFVDKCWN